MNPIPSLTPIRTVPSIKLNQSITIRFATVNYVILVSVGVPVKIARCINVSPSLPNNSDMRSCCPVRSIFLRNCLKTSSLVHPITSSTFSSVCSCCLQSLVTHSSLCLLFKKITLQLMLHKRIEK